VLSSAAARATSGLPQQAAAAALRSTATAAQPAACRFDHRNVLPARSHPPFPPHSLCCCCSVAGAGTAKSPSSLRACTCRLSRRRVWAEPAAAGMQQQGCSRCVDPDWTAALTWDTLQVHTRLLLRPPSEACLWRCIHLPMLLGAASKVPTVAVMLKPCPSCQIQRRGHPHPSPLRLGQGSSGVPSAARHAIRPSWSGCLRWAAALGPMMQGAAVLPGAAAFGTHA
jgi:hypothetical protein